MFDKILVVCVGNICRSPTAEHLLKQHLPHKEIRSAGLATEKNGLSGNDMDQQARTVAERHGYLFPQHIATQVSGDAIKWADLVLVMETNHREKLGQMYPEALGKTLLIGNWIGDTGKAKDIPDPYQKSDEAFEYVFELLDKAVATWVTKLN